MIPFYHTSQQDEDASNMIRNTASINVAHLLGVQYDALCTALVSKKLVISKHETVVKPLRVNQAIKALHALMQAVYGSALITS